MEPSLTLKITKKLALKLEKKSKKEGHRVEGAVFTCQRTICFTYNFTIIYGFKNNIV